MHATTSRGLVQQGLSVAGGALGFYQLGLATDKRCSLGGVLPHAAALVHCGGVGTLAQAVAAGCPQLVLPNHYDQFDNARRLQNAHLAHSYSGSEWGGALQRLLQDDRLVRACHERRAAATRGSGAIAEAVDLIQGLFPNTKG